MADVTINALSPIAPATGLFLPASDSTTTGRVTLSQVCGVMTGTQITTALGFTPYNGATNSNGYITANSTGTLTTDYLSVRKQNDVGEGGEIQLQGSSGFGGFQIDNFYGNCRIHTLAAGKQFQVLGGGIYAEGALTGPIVTQTPGMAKAWVHFNGTTGTQVGAEFHCTIVSQYNVSSVVRAGSGRYRINFATVMNNANYMTQYTGGYWPTQDTRIYHNINSDVAQTTAHVNVISVYQDGNSRDTDRGNVLVFGT